MNNDIEALKEYIKSQYSMANLKDLWAQIVGHKNRIEQLNKTLWTSQLDKTDEQAINLSITHTQSYMINLQNQFNNLITNSSGRNLMIFLSDGSRFVVNTYILNYMVSNNYITDELLLSLVEDNDTRVIPYTFFEKIKTNNELIPQIIGISEQQIILNDICLDTRRCVFNSSNYLLNENILKMLLIEFSNPNLRFGQTVNFDEISMIYKSITLSTDIIFHTLKALIEKSRCCFMFVIKTDRITFGWILEPISRSVDDVKKKKYRILLLFKIIEDVLYSFESTHLFYYFTFDLREKNPYMSITEEKYGDKYLMDDTFGDISEIKNILWVSHDQINLSVDENFGNKTLDNLDREHFIKVDQIQIYEINGGITDVLLQIIKPNANSQAFLSEPVPTSVFKKFNYTNETIKQKYKITTGIDVAIEDKKCDNRYCPIYHPYLCDADSNFRNNFQKNWHGKLVNKGHSKGNNAPCVSDKRFCMMDYKGATAVIDQENMLMRSMPSRKYSSKPIYCKIEHNAENKQEYNSDGGKYTLPKIQIRKRSKNQKRPKNQKMSKKNQF